jgi:hypothetical protein
MRNYVSLTCPNCGGKLEITEEIERFACSHCGNEHIVNRGVGIVSLAPVTQQLSQIQVGTDKTAAELAILRLRNELLDIDNEIINLGNRLENMASFKGRTHGILIRLKKGKFSEINKIHASEILKRILYLSEDELVKYMKNLDPKEKRKPKKGIQILDELFGIKNKIDEIQDKIELHKKIVE